MTLMLFGSNSDEFIVECFLTSSISPSEKFWKPVSIVLETEAAIEDPGSEEVAMVPGNEL